MKKIVVVVLFLANTVITHPKESLFMSKNAEYYKSLEANKTHIYFDIHGVLAVKSPKTLFVNGPYQFISSQKSFTGKLKLFGQLIYVLFNYKTYANMYKLYKQKNGKNKITESYFNVIKKQNCNKLHAALLEVANDIFTINKKMIPVLKELKEKGYQLHLLSNIGAGILKDAKKRKLFDEFLIYFKDQKNSINPEVQDVYPIFKPQKESYETALKAHGAKAEESIMIDDKAKNLPKNWAAGIVYNAKKHDQFIKELKKLHLL